MRIEKLIGTDVTSIYIAGHVNPDGDCCGTACALYHYLKTTTPEWKVQLFLAKPRDSLLFLPGMAEARFALPENLPSPDLLITVDVSTAERIALLREYLESAGRTLCIDHHESNEGFADKNIIVGDAASCAEVLYGLLDPAKIDKDCATALFTGIIYDSGVFQYNNTRPETLRIAADLMEKGADATTIIDGSFNLRTYPETRAIGFCLHESKLYLQDRAVATSLSQEQMSALQVSKKEIDQIVAQLRYVGGTEVAIFLYEIEAGKWKASLRSNGDFDVACLAAHFGGGGHAKAAGCTFEADRAAALANLLAEIEKEL